MQPFTKKQKFLIFCSGADIFTLSKCTTAEVKKYTLIGTCVLVPTILAFFSGGYSIYLVFDNYWAALLFAPVWAWVIFTLDKSIVANIKTSNITPAVLGRFFLAIVISLTIAEPIALRFFKDTINDRRIQELPEKQEKRAKEIDSLIRAYTQDSLKLEGKIDSLRKVFGEEVNVGNPKVNRLHGYGTVAKLNERLLREEEQRDSVKKQFIKTQIDSLTNKRNVVYLETAENDPRGLVRQITILNDLSVRYSTTWWILLFIRLLFFVVELVPILIKIGSSSKTKDLYNDTVERDEENCKSLQTQMRTEENSYSQQEQVLILQQSKAKLEFLIKKNNIDDAAKDYNFLLNVMEKIGQKHSKVNTRIQKEIEDEATREDLIAKVFTVYKNFSDAISTLLKKMADIYADKK